MKFDLKQQKSAMYNDIIQMWDALAKSFVRGCRQKV